MLKVKGKIKEVSCLEVICCCCCCCCC